MVAGELAGRRAGASRSYSARTSSYSYRWSWAWTASTCQGFTVSVWTQGKKRKLVVKCWKTVSAQICV